jgi:pimeloyl-ACP methyl ester carboxylesterase
MMRAFKTSDGLTLAYMDEGAGTPILCLAGLTRNSTDFNYMAPHAKDVRLIRLDMRGRGQSDFAPDFNTYNLVREAQDVLELLDHLEIPQAAIIGTSRGGLISMGIAAHQPERLLGVMLNDIGPVLEPVGLEAIMGFLGNRPPFKSYEEAVEELPILSAGFANIPKERWKTEVRSRWIEKTDGLHLRYDPKLRDAVLAQSHGNTVDLWEYFDAYASLPLALVRGENSDLLSPETVKQMQARRPDMIYAEIKDRAHIPFLDEPDALNVLEQFLKEVR